MADYSGVYDKDFFGDSTPSQPVDGWSTWMARGFGKSSVDEFWAELIEIYKLHESKRSDYTAGASDRLANYRFSSSMIGVSVERGMFMRMSEKFYRLKSLFEKGGEVSVGDESMQDTLRDIAILAVLMKLSMDNGEYGNPEG